ncbi:hemin ABC transporter substrate-binding protein [Aliidiomarina minuta]|uniref:Hemin ABC transporter substrate-binding protein n=1 Tax=Aliidiomarina minuta TaxID=880057 RepID=A0A432W4M7_9GAMM|nr:ABC transporter substrate-binding protein [Aliidiomarina minuta]RUO24357.1 hemin ABC transporter substrate-binding protein [Aliidiomarina minuta]
MKLISYLFAATLVIVYLLVPAQAQTPRIVVTGGSLTDVVFAVGGEAQVVAVDSSSLSPAEAQQKPVVGYYRDLSAEGVLSVSPTHVWALEGTGSDQTLRQIARTGVTVEHFAKPESVADLIALVERVGAELGREGEAQQVVASIEKDLMNVAALTTNESTTDNTSSLRALFVLQASDRGIVAAGRNTVPALLFSYAQVANLIEHDGYKPVSTEYLAVSQPDFLVAPSHVVEAAGGREQFCAQSSLRLLHAARDCQLLVLDSMLALGMTTRIADAIQQVYTYAHASPSA